MPRPPHVRHAARYQERHRCHRQSLESRRKRDVRRGDALVIGHGAPGQRQAFSSTARRKRWTEAKAKIAKKLGARGLIRPV